MVYENRQKNCLVKAHNAYRIMWKVGAGINFCSFARSNMTNNFIGVIIEESLEKKEVLKKVKIIRTKIEKVTARHKTPWVEHWTLHTVEILENQAAPIAEELSKSLDPRHSWYADFKNNSHHYIIFRQKVFFIDRQSKKQYDEVKQYGIFLGIPAYQVDFHPEIKKW